MSTRTVAGGFSAPSTSSSLEDGGMKKSESLSPFSQLEDEPPERGEESVLNTPPETPRLNEFPVRGGGRVLSPAEFFCEYFPGTVFARVSQAVLQREGKICVDAETMQQTSKECLKALGKQLERAWAREEVIEEVLRTISEKL